MPIDLIFNQILAFDFLVAGFIQGFHDPLITIALQVLTEIGNPAVWFLVAAAYYWLGKENDSAFIILLILFTAAISALIKMYIARPRPYLEANLVENKSSLLDALPETEYAQYSFPSGHSTMISSAYFYFRDFVSGNKQKLLILAIIVVSLSRLYLGKHFLTDVLAGIVLGGFIGWTAVELKDKYAGKQFNWHSRKAKAINVIIVILLLVLVLSRDYTYIAIFLSYFAGFLHFKRMKLNLYRPTNLKQIILRLGGGFFVLGILALLLISSNAFIAIIALALMGLWISLIYPLILVKHKKWVQGIR